jgi:hypothetical protein
VRSRPRKEEDTPLVSRGNAIHNQQLPCDNDTARRMAAISK